MRRRSPPGHGAGDHPHPTCRRVNDQRAGGVDVAGDSAAHLPVAFPLDLAAEQARRLRSPLADDVLMTSPLQETVPLMKCGERLGQDQASIDWAAYFTFE